MLGVWKLETETQATRPIMQTTAAHIKAKVHPNYRALGLSNIAMLRQMIREGRQVISARSCIKQEQRNMLAQRRALARAQAQA